MNEDHKKLIDHVLAIAQARLRTCEDLTANVYTIDETGKQDSHSIDPARFMNDSTKTILTKEIRKSFKKAGIVRYAFVFECWLTRMPLIPAVPATNDYLDKYIKKYTAEYEKCGYSPRHGGGRDECLVIYVGDRLNSSISIYKIVRHAKTGFVTQLEPVTHSGASAQIAGRFVNLLEGQVH